jgi:hypothetical protein
LDSFAGESFYRFDYIDDCNTTTVGRDYSSYPYLL